MPAWITVIALICVTWRLLIFAGKLNYPGKIIRIIVVIFTLFVSASQIRNTGVGLDSAAGLLTLGTIQSHAGIANL
jgi:hypothetical protein